MDLDRLPGIELSTVVVHDAGETDLDLEGLSLGVPVVPWSEFLDGLSARHSTFDVGISALFGELIPDVVISRFSRGIVNLHPSLLPHGRGKHPATWAIWEGSPYGASVHLVTSGVDSGPLLAQVEVPVDATDTSQSLYSKGLSALWDLYLLAVKPWVLGADPDWREQPAGGSLHRTRDLIGLQEFALESNLRAEDFVRLLRALTMGPGTGLVIPLAAQEVVVSVQVSGRRFGSGELFQ